MNALAPLDDAQLGPCMQALPTAKMRAYVVAAVEFPKKRGRWLYAAKMAGYGNEGSTNKTLSAIGGRLAADERIVAAIEEESRKRLRALSPSAVHALDRMVENPGHRDHARAVAMVLDRSDPVQANFHVQHAHEHRHQHVHLSGADRDQALLRIKELSAKLGAPVVDAEFTEVAAP